MTDLLSYTSYPHSFCGNDVLEDSDRVQSGYIRRSEEVTEADSPSLIGGDSPGSQLTSLERLELQKLRQEVAELRTELAAKHDFAAHESPFAASASSCAASASTFPNSSPAETCSHSSFRDVLSPTSTGFGQSPCSPAKTERWDWVLQERAYSFARDFFLDAPGQRTRRELRTALEQTEDIAVFFSEHYPSFFNGNPTEVVGWDDFVQAYVQHCKKSKPMSTTRRISDARNSEATETCASEFDAILQNPEFLSSHLQPQDDTGDFHQEFVTLPQWEDSSQRKHRYCHFIGKQSLLPFIWALSLSEHREINVRVYHSWIITFSHLLDPESDHKKWAGFAASLPILNRVSTQLQQRPGRFVGVEVEVCEDQVFLFFFFWTI